MKKRLMFNILALLFVVGYGVGAWILYRDNAASRAVSRMEILVKDIHLAQFITPEKLRSRLDSLTPKDMLLVEDSLDYQRLEDTIETIPYVKNVEIYKNMQGECVVELSQFIPKLRVISSTGYDFYLDSLCNILPPPKNYYFPTPVVTTDTSFDFANDQYMQKAKKNGSKDAIFLEKLINFVEITESDEFLCDLITQIYLDDHRNITLIPRFAGQEILLGEPTELHEKIKKLKTFYAHLFSRGGWQDITTIDLRFNQQVVVKTKPEKQTEQQK